VTVRPLGDADREWVRAKLRELWGGIVVGRGAVHDPSALPGFVAEAGGEPVGLLTYRIDGDECEVVTIDAFPKGAGAGTALLDAAAGAARGAGCRRLWLITTNDNLRALRFYQRRGFHLVAVRPNALARSRELKPSIPEIGLDGIPLRDELELELDLSG
jgi:ribosomal protein S18 acetylase RimI-like enzyme